MLYIQKIIKAELYESGLGSHQSFKRSTNIPTRVFCTNFFFGKGKMMEKKHWCQAIRVRCTIELSLLASMFKMEMSLKPSYKL